MKLAIDDFGTGYSSLSYLQKLPIDTLKIDRSFIERLEDSSQSQEIVRTIVALAHSLDMKVTAEGIERSMQHSKLHEIACETGQGYLYSKPISQGSIDELLQENEKYLAGGRSVHFGTQCERAAVALH